MAADGWPQAGAGHGPVQTIGGRVSRGALVERLGGPARVIPISAPAGRGKTLARPLTGEPSLDGWAVIERLVADLGLLEDPLWLVIDHVHGLLARFPDEVADAGPKLTVLAAGENRTANGARREAGTPAASGARLTRTAPPKPALPEPLTDSETRVLRYLPTNLQAPEIAGELTLSVHTIRTHIRHLYQKLAVHSRTEAVAQARVLGLLTPAPGSG
jgi:ATP/maltotriose-dependent transcriptional regulator MalT